MYKLHYDNFLINEHDDDDDEFHMYMYSYIQTQQPNLSPSYRFLNNINAGHFVHKSYCALSYYECYRHSIVIHLSRFICSDCSVAPRATQFSRTRLRNYSRTATSHSRWPCFSSGRCTGLECIAFVGQKIVDVLGVSSPAENTAKIQGILWFEDRTWLRYLFVAQR